MSATVDINRLAAAKAKGKRPHYLDSFEAEKVLNIALALAQELSVARERIDTLERLLDAKGLVKRAEIESFMPSPTEAAERGAWTQAFIARVLRVVQQEIEAIAEPAGHAATVDDLSRE
jgi:hypothetical protein